MAGLLDLFSGRSSDIYGNGLLTPEQRGGLGNIGLLALAGKLGQLAGPSFSPVPDFGAALGQAAGAYGASQEGAGTAALNAILTGQKGRKLEQELDYYKQLGPILQRAAQGWPGADGGTAATPETGSTGGGAVAPAGAGGGGGATPGTITLDQARQAAINAGFTGPAVDIAAATGMAESNGNPLAHNTKGEDSYGYMQLNAAAHGDKVKTFDLQEQMNQAFKISNGGTNFSPWTMYRNGQYRKYLPQGGAAPTAAAPDAVRVPYNYGAPGGGLLNLPDPTGRARLLGIDPNASININPAADGIDPSKIGPNATGQTNPVPPGLRPLSGVPGASPAALEEPPGFAGRQLVAQLLARPPIDDPSQYQQVAGPGGGDAPGGMASGLLTPGGPLTRGVPGMPAMPPAAAPSADPSLQLGPLAAPAPAAAAPAAPGPGLLSPPGMPAAAALPRVNPAFDAYARNLAVAAGLAKGAGLPDALGPLLEMFKGSTAYKAQQTIAEKTAAQPFEQAQTLFNKQVEIAGVGPIEAAKLPYALAQTYFKAEQDIRTAGPVAAAQNFERIRADNAAKGIITTMGPDGQIKLAIDPDAVKAVTGATATIAGDTAGAQERARLQQQAELQPGISGQTKYAETAATQDAAARQQAITARNTLPLLDDSRQQLAGAGIFSGPTANLDMTLAQLASIGGWPSDKLVNTQTYLQQAGVRAAAVLQSGAFGTGSGVSSNDLRAAERISAGDNTIDIRTIRRIMDLAERKAVRDIDTFNSIAQKRDPTSAIEHPTRWTGRTTGSGERIMRKPDGSLEVETR